METPRILLDTNVLLAALMGPERVTAATRELLVDPARDVRFSAASVWEVAIKRSLQRERFDFEPAEVHELAVQAGFGELPVRAEHVYGLSELPMHHRDPFDRLLVCQARRWGRGWSHQMASLKRMGMW